MKVVKPYDSIVVIALGIIVLAALVWSFIGSIPESVTAMGVMISSDEIIDVKYTRSNVEFWDSLTVTKKTAFQS